MLSLIKKIFSKNEKSLEHQMVQDNLVRFSNCLSGKHMNPQFAGNRMFVKSHTVTGR